MNVKSHDESVDITCGYIKGSKKAQPKPAIVVDNNCYVWRGDSWEYLANHIAHQVFISQQPQT